MHNYLKTLDTNQLIRIKLRLIPIGKPNVTVHVAERFYFNSNLIEELVVETKIGLHENLDLSISLSGKQYGQDETAVMIEEFLIDDFSVFPNYTGHAIYTNDQNYTQPTTYMGFNGDWNFSLTEPFYHWRHRVTGQGWLLTP